MYIANIPRRGYAAAIQRETRNEAQEETDIPVQLSDLVADMVAESLRHIPEGYDGNHPCVQNAGSRIDVFEIWVSASGNGHGSGIQSVA